MTLTATSTGSPATAGLPPGPRLPGPLQTLRYTFDQPRMFARARTEFGPTWTLRLPGMPPGVVTTDREAIKRLFTGDPLTKRHGNDLLRPFLGDRSLLLLEPAEHLARRRLELPPFHGEAVRAYEGRIRELAAEEIATWADGDVVETHARARDLTLAIILELVLGVRDAGLRTQLGSIVDSFNTPLGNLAQFLPEQLTRRSRWNLPGRALYARRDHLHGLLAAHIAATRADPRLADRRDVLAGFVRAQDEDGATLTDADLRDELLTLVVAGHETTATAVAWACDLLAHHPEVATRLRASLAEGRRDLLAATAREVLRVRTVNYLSAARFPLEPFPIGKWVLPPGVVVLVDAQGLHLDPDLHDRPDEFRPERFLERQPDAYSYLPFGGGAHRCLGAPLASLELELVLEAIVSTLHLSPAGPPARAVRRGISLAPAGGGRVRAASL